MNGKDGILIVDDEFSVRDSMARWFEEEGYRVGQAESGEAALDLLEDSAWDIALVDVRMPGMDGLELLGRLLKKSPETIVIIITAHATVGTAVEAFKAGAFDYITKPFDPDDVSRVVARALRQKDLILENRRLRECVKNLVDTNPMIGESAGIERIRELIGTVAGTESTVLIRGRSGTGKEVVARAIHNNSKRQCGPLVAINCGALSESLLESELFGHARGAFTGAQSKRRGKLELANGGTLFLDEIGAISMKTQLDLLRVLDTREFSRLGCDNVRKVDFRIICATNRDLEEAMAEGTFREDFFYRINVFTVFLPNLAERREDIPLLVEHFVGRFCDAMGREPCTVPPATMDILLRHDWPGNVRELENAIERGVVLARRGVIRPEDLGMPGVRPDEGAMGETIAEMERRHIEETLRQTGRNIKRAAGILGINRATLYNKIRKYDID